MTPDDINPLPMHPLIHAHIYNTQDDIIATHQDFSATMRLAINIVYESAALGLSLKIEKCSLFPRHRVKALGTIVDLASFKFKVSATRAEKIRQAVRALSAAIRANPDAVPAKMVASFIGLIWFVPAALVAYQVTNQQLILAQSPTGLWPHAVIEQPA